MARDSFIATNIIEQQTSMLKVSDKVQKLIVRDAIRLMGTKVKGEIRKNTPRSKITGTTLKLSRKSALARGGRGLDHLKKSIADKPSSQWKNSPERRGIIGTAIGHDKQKQGFHSHLVQEGHRAAFWSKTITGHVQGIDYFRKTFDETTQDFNKTIINKFRQNIGKIVAKNP